MKIEHKDSGKKDMQTKSHSGHVLECKIEERNGVQVGIIEGYIATWDLDRGNGFLRDQFVKGCFRKSIRELKRRKRQLRFKDHHGRTVGGFPPETLKEDAKGLFGRGEINLEVQQGAEAYSLAKQNVLVDFSIGFSVVKSNRDEQNDIRTITEAIIWENSIVDEPMNPEAQITAVKSDEEKEMEEVTEEEVKDMTKRDLEDALRGGREFTKQAAKTVASLFEGKAPPETEEEKAARVQKEKDDKDAADEAAIEEKNLGDILESLNGTKDLLNK